MYPGKFAPLDNLNYKLKHEVIEHVWRPIDYKQPKMKITTDDQTGQNYSSNCKEERLEGHQASSSQVMLNDKTRTEIGSESLEAQMEVGQQEAMPENNDKLVVTQTIATFDEKNEYHDEDCDGDEYEYLNTMPSPDLDMFLCRPQIIATVNWATTDALGQSMGVYNFPTVLFTTTYMNKLEKMAFWRPDVEISIRMNGTPMHYGRIVFAWVPQGNSLNTSFTSDYRSAFSNHWTQVSANANQATVLRVPFTHFKEFLSIGKTNEDLFTLYTFVSVPLSSMNGAAPAIDYTIYARVTKPNLIGYNYQTSWTAQMDTMIPKQRKRSVKGKTEAENLTEEGKVISSSVTSLGDSIGKFSWVPVLGKFAEPVATGVKLFGNVLRYLGLSIPPNLAPTQPMQLRNPRFLQFEDLPTTLTLGPSPDYTVAKDYALVNDHVESSSILKFIQRPGLMYTGQIVSTLVPGNLIFNASVTPIRCYGDDYVSTINFF